jgi:uncharacterized protein involved in exopolysaccharide biosynthesis
LRNTLIQQSATLAPSHPTIRQLQARISALEGALGGSVVDSETGDGVTVGAGAATRQLARIEEIEAQIAVIDDQTEADAARMRSLEESIRRAPEVELALNALERNYQGLQTQYRNAVLKQAQAETGERLESSQQAERFQIIEQAIASTKPISPNRPLIMAAGFVASGAVGLGLMVLAELLDRSLRTVRDLQRNLDMRPLVVIPVIDTRREAAIRSYAVRIGVLVALVALGGAVFMVDRFYLPLPVLAERIVSAIGLERVLARLGG